MLSIQVMALPRHHRSPLRTREAPSLPRLRGFFHIRPCCRERQIGGGYLATDTRKSARRRERTKYPRTSALFFLQALVGRSIPHTGSFFAIDLVCRLLPASRGFPFVADSRLGWCHVRTQILPEFFVLFVLYRNDYRRNVLQPKGGRSEGLASDDASRKRKHDTSFDG